jgi:two-component system, LytTR family, response regulator
MKTKIKTIVVDDERLARKDLISLLSEYNDIEIVGEADSITASENLIKSKEPDLIFLDIQMGGESGFDLLEKIDVDAKVIFVTAFDEFAIKAFEVDAIDYLLKPVNPDRLRKAVEKMAKENIIQPSSFRKLQYEDKMFLSISNHLKFIKVDSILCIQSAGDYSELISTDGKKGLVLKSMMEWEERLPQNYFCRIHRTTIINMEYINRLEDWFNNSYRVYLKGIDMPFIMSRRYAAKIKEKMG